MKQSTTVDQLGFETAAQLRHHCRKARHTVIGFYKRLPVKKLLQQTSAILGLGAVMLLSFYLFCTQLAEFGW